MKKILSIVLSMVLVIGITFPAAAFSSKVAAKYKVDNTKFDISISSSNLADEPSGVIKAYKDEFLRVYKLKYPNANVIINTIPSEKYFDVLKAQMASGTGADVIQFQAAQVAVFAKAGYISDLSAMPFVSRIDGVAKTQASYMGKIYAAPFEMGTNGVWYNRKMFTDNNIAVPKNWAEFLKICKFFKAKGITPLAAGFKDAWVANMTVEVFAVNDYSSATFEKDVYNGKTKLNGPELIKTFTKLQQLQNNKYFGTDALSNNWDMQSKEFANGKAAMIIHGSYIGGFVNLLLKDQKKELETGFFPLPNDAGKPSVLPLGAGTLTGVNASTKNIQRAKDLVTAMYDDNAQIIRDKTSGTFPAMKGINIDYKELGNKDLLKAIGTTKQTIGNQFLTSSVSDIFGKCLTKICAGKMFSRSWLDEADRAEKNDKATVTPPVN